MILYHGTTESALRAVLDEGCISPRWDEPGRWQGFPAHPAMVYLTDAYAIYFATCFSENDDRGVVIEVDVDEKSLRPDEDFMEQATRGNVEETKDMSLEEATEYWKERIEFMPANALLSLQHLGTVAHVGPIGVERIKRIAYINDPVRLAMMFDPTITIMNYQIMGQYYRDSMRWLFDRKPIQRAHPGIDKNGELVDSPIPAWEEGVVEVVNLKEWAA